MGVGTGAMAAVFESRFIVARRQKNLSSLCRMLSPR